VTPSTPTRTESTSYELIEDEATWNQSFASGVLKKYYAQNPSEDLWNSAENRAANWNDRVYVAEVDGVEGEYAATWGEAYQKLTGVTDNSVYYVTMSAEAGGTYDLYEDEGTTPANKTITINEVTYPSCQPSYQGFIGNGGQLPWICPNFDEDVAAKLIFDYDGTEYTPWGDTIFGTGDGHKAWGIESAANLGIANFDVSKFTMYLEA
jgi:hypothetical protein